MDFQSQIPQLSLPNQQASNNNSNNPAGISNNNNPQQKELNVLTLCRIGQETVQDILSRFQDVFSILKNHQPPNGINGSAMISADKRQKMQDQFRTIRLLFKRLRLLYEKCENSDEYIEIESLIPYVDDTAKPHDTQSNPEEHEKALAENCELNDILKEKNLQLKDLIDRIRRIISDVCTMISARKY